MAGGNKCAACGGQEFEVGDYQRACTNCGVLIDDCELVADFAAICGPSSTEFRGYSRSLPTKYAAMNDTTLRQFKAGKKRLREICSVLHFPEDMLAEAKHLLDRVAAHPDVIHMRVENKLHATVACAYVVCLQRRWPMSVENVASISGYCPADILRFKKFIVKEFGLTVEHLDVSEIVSPMIGEMHLSVACRRLTEDIVFVCKDTWITHGRNPVFVVTAAIFLAWQSEMFVERHKVKYQIFAKSHEMKVSSTVQQRLREMIDIFVKLAKQLPWMDENKKLNKNTVIEFIPDVCRNKKSLIMKALAAAEEEENGATEEISESVKAEPKEETSDSCKRKSCEFDPPSFKNNARKRRMLNSDVATTTIPACVDYNGDLNAEELCELDIPEEQMCRYIKSEKEVQAQAKMRKIAASEETHTARQTLG